MSASKATNIQPKRILVITQRYLGDTLLITPLLGSLKKAYPDAEIDVLLPASNTGVLEGNPDVNQCITFPKKPSILNFLRLLLSLFQNYDLAISTQTSDRTTLCAIVAGKIKLGFVDEEYRKSWWKKYLLTNALVFHRNSSHAVLENLKFCNLLKIQPHYTVTPPSTSPISNQLDIKRPYVIIHIMPQWRYKQWHSKGWQDLITFINNKSYQIILTGSNQPSEIKALNELQKEYPYLINIAGKTSLAELTELITNASFFVGPDTGITHLAAATGTKTYAIFGPTDPAKWAPWPQNYACEKTPFDSMGSKTINNVCLIQAQSNQLCVPCQQEGCDRNRFSHSKCLDNLESQHIIDAISNTL
jgi:heptosyltransferase-3